ncbi:hypothetical protein FRC12_019368, partial [Ceratobasidium sp. 428]
IPSEGSGPGGANSNKPGRSQDPIYRTTYDYCSEPSGPIAGPSRLPGAQPTPGTQPMAGPSSALGYGVPGPSNSMLQQNVAPAVPPPVVPPPEVPPPRGRGRGRARGREQAAQQAAQAAAEQAAEQAVHPPMPLQPNPAADLAPQDLPVHQAQAPPVLQNLPQGQGVAQVPAQQVNEDELAPALLDNTVVARVAARNARAQVV